MDAAECAKLCCSHCQGCHHHEAHSDLTKGLGLEVGQPEKHRRTCPLVCLDYTCGVVWWVLVSVGVLLGGICTCCFCCCGCCSMCRSTDEKPELDSVTDPKQKLEERVVHKEDVPKKDVYGLDVIAMRRQKFNASFFKSRELKPKAPVLFQPSQTADQFSRMLDGDAAFSSPTFRREGEVSSALVEHTQSGSVRSGEGEEELERVKDATPGREDEEPTPQVNQSQEWEVPGVHSPLLPSPPRSPANRRKSGSQTRLPDADFAVSAYDPAPEDERARSRSRSTRSRTPASSLNLSLTGNVVSRSSSDLERHQFNIQDLVCIHHSSSGLAGSGVVAVGRRALQISSGIDVAGGMQWELFGFLLLAWILTYVIIRKGLHNSGKIVWVTALFPYFVLIILLVRAVTLPGAADGLYFYVTPEFERLKNPAPWLDAGSQVLFSFGLAMGTLFALGSYNQFNNNCFRDAILVGCINSGTSLFAGVVTFSVLGFMANEKGVEVKDVVDSGPGLAFLVYPEVVARLPGAPIWAILFFLMFVTLGIDTLFCTVEGFVTALVDAFPEKLLKRRSKLIVVCCIMFFLLALPMVTNGGVYLLTLWDYYGSAGMTILLTVICQAVVFVWIWGDDKVANAAREMFGGEVPIILRWCWKYIGPGFLLFVFVFYFVNYAPVTYGTYEYPGWAEALGFLIASSSMVFIPGYAVYYVYQQKDCTILEAIQRGFTSSADIGPRGDVFTKDNPVSESERSTQG